MSDSTTVAAQRPGELRSPLTPRMLSHAAWVTHDVEATADFYTRIMGMEIAATVLDDKVPSTGDAFPYFHIFFRMTDGSTMAFFEAPGLPPAAASTHPAYDVFNHFAMQAATPEELNQWREWLCQNGIEVLGPINHRSILSIYFHDPNGLRLEIATPLTSSWNRRAERGQADLAAWIAAKERKTGGKGCVQSPDRIHPDSKAKHRIANVRQLSWLCLIDRQRRERGVR